MKNPAVLKRPLAVTVCCAFVFIILGCSDDDPDPPGPQPPPPFGGTPGASDIRLDTDPPGSAASVDVRIACSENQVYVVWSDMRNGSFPDVYFNSSNDGGENWRSSDIRLDTDGPGISFSTYPCIACSGVLVFVAWNDSRSGTSSDIYFNRSADGGDTWLAADTHLDTDSAGAIFTGNPQIACSGNDVFVVWEDARNGGAFTDIFLNHSSDAGNNWEPADIRINTNSAGSSNSNLPQVACAGSNVYVVWKDFRNGDWDIYFNRSADLGGTWLASDIKLNTNIAGTSSANDPRIASDGLNVYIAWADYRNGSAADIYFNKSSDGGMTWQATDVRLDTDSPGAANSMRHQVACAGMNVYIVWADSRNGVGTEDIYLNYSNDGGSSWQSSDIRLDKDSPGAADSDFPRIACAGDGVYVTWSEKRSGDNKIYFNYSLDRGATWQTPDIRIDRSDIGVSHTADIACSNYRVYIVWSDTRNAPVTSEYDVYFNYVR